jgi:glucose-fructose oxidoreductase
MKKVRYAVVGLGHISQGALMPGFKNARNSELTALVSGDAAKLRKLAKLYGVSHTYSYQQYDECLKSGEFDAVYIGLPNQLHCDYTVRAAAAGIHVLCEKPMAVNAGECERMIAACDAGKVKLMIAYRLHFEEGNLEAIRTASSGKLGELRIFHATFSQQVADKNVRTEESENQGGGSVYDMGVYCINAARYMFRDEPMEVFAAAATSPTDQRFKNSAEMTSAILRFPGDRLALVTSSFGAAQFSEFCLIGTKGHIRLAPAYDYKQPIVSEVVIGTKTKKKQYRETDQFGAELIYFSDCILENREPEPNGVEGLADVRVVRAILESVRTKGPIQLPPFKKVDRPTLSQLIRKPPVKQLKLVDAPPPTR